MLQSSSSSSSSFIQLVLPYQYYVLFVVQSLSSLLSLCGSITIAVASYRARRFQSIYQRLIFMISISDTIVSISYLLHPFLVPSSTNQYGLLFAIGNNISCNIIGSLLIFSTILTMFYSYYMSFYFYIKIKYNTSDTIMRQKYEIKCTIIAFSISLSIPLYAYISFGYRPEPFWNICGWTKCSILDNIETCYPTMKDTHYLLGLVTTFIALCLFMGSVIVMFGVYWSVRTTIRKNKIYHFNHNSSSHITTNNSNNYNYATNNSRSSPEQLLDNGSEIMIRRDTIVDNNSNNFQHNESYSDCGGDSSLIIHNNNRRRIHNKKKKIINKLIIVRNQSFLLALAYWNSFLWILMIFITTEHVRDVRREQIMISRQEGYPLGYYILILISFTFAPLQGFLNFIIYTRPRYLEYRKLYKDKSYYYAIREACSFKPVNFDVNCNRRLKSSNRINCNNNSNDSNMSSDFFNVVRRKEYATSCHKMNVNSSTILQLTDHPQQKIKDNDDDKIRQKWNHNQELLQHKCCHFDNTIDHFVIPSEDVFENIDSSYNDETNHVTIHSSTDDKIVENDDDDIDSDQEDEEIIFCDSSDEEDVELLFNAVDSP